MTCSQARDAIRSAKVLFTPDGPAFSTHGYACRSSNILPRIDPSPIQLPAVENCSGPAQHKLSFIWDYPN